MKTTIAIALVLAAVAGTATAQPAPGSGSGVGAGSPAIPAPGAPARPDGIMMKPDDLGKTPPAADKAACVALAREDVEWFRGQCSATVGDALTALPALEEAHRQAGAGAPVDPTQAWAYALVEQLWPVTRRIKAEDLTEQTNQMHEKAAQEIATDRKHVVLAYAAMWLLSVGFLIFLWRRQQGLRSQIDELKRDLDAAVKGGS